MTCGFVPNLIAALANRGLSTSEAGVAAVTGAENAGICAISPVERCHR